MDVFLSWSSERSKKLANIFNDWISNVLPTVKTYISTEQIGPGDRWSESIGKGLESNFMGIFFMVEENVSSPWLNFEAGAISKNIEDSKVIPLLHEMRPEQINGPMAQFQAKLINQEEDIFSIVKQINVGITDERKINSDKLRKLFDKWYPDFDEAYKKFTADNPKPEKVKEDNSSDLLDSEEQIGEILNIVRDLKRSGIIKSNLSSVDRNANMEANWEETRRRQNERFLRNKIRKELIKYNTDSFGNFPTINDLENIVLPNMKDFYNKFPKELVNDILEQELNMFLSKHGYISKKNE